MTASVSVVVAARDAGERIADCLRALGPACARRGVDCVVVATGRPPSRALLARVAPAARVVPVAGDPLTPELWTRGILVTRSDVVALTTADCVPVADWLDRIMAAPWDRIAALGGSFELQRASAPRTAAIFYQRYSGYLRSRTGGFVAELAADNAAYRRDCLMACADRWKDGFWEPEVHRWLRARGRRLQFDPDMLVYFEQRTAVRVMARQRYLHGWWFGAQRAAGEGGATRVLRVLSAPAIPAVLFARILTRLAATRRLTGGFVRGLPLLWLYLLSWSLGELTGYLHDHPPPRGRDSG